MNDGPVKDDDRADGRSALEDGESAVEAEEKKAPAEKSDTDKPKPKKKKVKYVDDGHTVYSMDGLDEARGIKRRGDGIKLSRKEKWAAIRAAFARFLPIFLGVVGCFSLTALLLYFWLK